jgi:hypothetical protein
MNIGTVTVIFRWPKLPVIVASPMGLAAAHDRNKLITVLGALTPTDYRFEVKVIDSTGREFWYDSSQRILAPGFTTKVWTKLQLVELYNDSSGVALGLYMPGSLSNRRLNQIVQDIASLLMGGQADQKRSFKHDKSTSGQAGEGAAG